MNDHPVYGPNYAVKELGQNDAVVIPLLTGTARIVIGRRDSSFLDDGW